MSQDLAAAYLAHLEAEHAPANTIAARARVLRSVGSAGTATREDIEAWWATRRDLSPATESELAEAAVLLSEEPAVALWLGQSEVTSDGLHALAEIKHLQAITLPARQTTPDDFATLAKAPELFLVALAGDGLSDEALKPLSQLPALTHLLVVAPLLGDEALEHVRQLEQLTHFIYFKTPFSQQALDALRKARPSLQVIEHKPRYGC